MTTKTTTKYKKKKQRKTLYDLYDFYHMCLCGKIRHALHHDPGSILRFPVRKSILSFLFEFIRNLYRNNNGSVK